MAEMTATVLTVACILAYTIGGVVLFFLLKAAGIEKVGSVGVKSFVGTFSDNVFQVILRYSPAQFSEFVGAPAARRAQKISFYASRLLLACLVILAVIRWLD